MQTYNFIKTSTAGNRTGFILGAKAYLYRKEIMSILLRKKNLEAEQFAFLWNEGNAIRMEMAGGELCGGAILAGPVLLGKVSQKVMLGSLNYQLLSIMVNRSQTVWQMQTKLPRKVIKDKEKIIFGKMKGFKVILDGIAYFVTKDQMKADNIEYFRDLDRALNTGSIPALGIVQIINDQEIIPTIWVKNIGSLVSEQGCTTGTIAAQLSYKRKGGWWTQPSGEQIKVLVNDEIELEAGVEMLSEGRLYLRN